MLAETLWWDKPCLRRIERSKAIPAVYRRGLATLAALPEVGAKDAGLRAWRHTSVTSLVAMRLRTVKSSSLCSSRQAQRPTHASTAVAQRVLSQHEMTQAESPEG